MSNLKIEWVNKSQKRCLKFTFNEKLTVEDATSIIEKWQNHFKEFPKEKIIIIWDCIKMTGYDSSARTKWQSALKEMKEQIDSIWLITNSSLIKMGASFISVFASYPINVVNSENEIKI